MPPRRSAKPTAERPGQRPALQMRGTRRSFPPCPTSAGHLARICRCPEPSAFHKHSPPCFAMFVRARRPSLASGSLLHEARRLRNLGRMENVTRGPKVCTHVWNFSLPPNRYANVCRARSRHPETCRGEKRGFLPQTQQYRADHMAGLRADGLCHGQAAARRDLRDKTEHLGTRRPAPDPMRQGRIKPLRDAVSPGNHDVPRQGLNKAQPPVSW